MIVYIIIKMKRGMWGGIFQEGEGIDSLKTTKQQRGTNSVRDTHGFTLVWTFVEVVKRVESSTILFG